jgi:hypothetical protein
MEEKFIANFEVNPVNVQKINELTLSMGVTLPNALRSLLIMDGKIVFTVKKFIRVIDVSFKQEVTIESILTIDEITSAMEYIGDEDDIVANKILVFGESLGSQVIGIGLGEPNYNNIYVFDWDFGLTKVANSFEEFIVSLY